MQNPNLTEEKDSMLSYEAFKESVLRDYRIAVESREASLLGRREVLTGKAKFGIFGDGKEVAQVALSRFFQKGDFRSGYYRDQTWMFALGIATVENFFSQLYADTDPINEPMSGGRNMVAHHATPNTDQEGNWLPLVEQYNTGSDMAPTAGQMPRALGLAYTSKLFRNLASLQTEAFAGLSHKGNEICFCSIGDAATSEGHFWEIVNASGVNQVPLAIFVWDDGYGISVPVEKQTVKGSISKALQGFQAENGSNGLDIYTLKGWDYAGMCEILEPALRKVREEQIPAIFHVQELTQPQGHSTSGSHERYKSAERLQWERNWDCMKKMRDWIEVNGIATVEELDEIHAKSRAFVRESKNSALQKYAAPLVKDKESILSAISFAQNLSPETNLAIKDLTNSREPLKRDILQVAARVLEEVEESSDAQNLNNLYVEFKRKYTERYDSNMMDEGPKSALKVEVVKPAYPNNPSQINGYEIINKYFDELFARNASVFAFGEDLGKIGDVNQGFAGLQDKYGKLRVSDTGIRELSIMGKGIGMALRGLRPIAEVQYVDYIYYALEPLADDVAGLFYRTDGKQSCPIIVRTRGHRLEGIFHSGSPMGVLINSLRGMHVCVPRNFVQAAGMYNTLLKSNDPAIVIECLNGYRLKEQLPNNLAEMTVPLGIPEILEEGNDITIVTYGSTLRIVLEATERLRKKGIHAEVIDVQTLLPFDTNHLIVESLKKTSRILFIDEDMPGATAAYMFQQVMEVQNGYRWLDVAPRTLTAKAHRPAYASDGDYFSKPNVEDVIQIVSDMMAE
ncbi:MAG: transketolase [Pseudopedobacter saltans]|uniref:3-methyl-2-oxobutanoate dehydrogenase (2-methylpropanoyl-transferring) n=1 Tax=Pseudopedobacter saltans TaxID=151895 RepID=A0A2W5FA84_9SPHI|nr:MAG: transketolase [Pseudopedobacter saltans]